MFLSSVFITLVIKYRCCDQCDAIPVTLISRKRAKGSSETGNCNCVYNSDQASVLLYFVLPYGRKGSARNIGRSEINENKTMYVAATPHRVYTNNYVRGFFIYF